MQLTHTTAVVVVTPRTDTKRASRCYTHTHAHTDAHAHTRTLPCGGTHTTVATHCMTSHRTTLHHMSTARCHQPPATTHNSPHHWHAVDRLRLQHHHTSTLSSPRFTLYFAAQQLCSQHAANNGHTERLPAATNGVTHAATGAGSHLHITDHLQHTFRQQSPATHNVAHSCQRSSE